MPLPDNWRDGGPPMHGADMDAIVDAINANTANLLVLASSLPVVVTDHSDGTALISTSPVVIDNADGTVTI